MIKKEDDFSISRQCDLLSISRSFYYYVPVGLSDTDLAILEKIDILYTDDPTRGQRRLRHALKKEYKISVGRAAIRPAAAGCKSWESQLFIPGRTCPGLIRLTKSTPIFYGDCGLPG